MMYPNNGKHIFCNEIHLFSIVIIETCCTNPRPKLIVSFLSLTNSMHTAIYTFSHGFFENATGKYGIDSNSWKSPPHIFSLLLFNGSGGVKLCHLSFI